MFKLEKRAYVGVKAEEKKKPDLRVATHPALYSLTGINKGIIQHGK